MNSSTLRVLLFLSLLFVLCSEASAQLLAPVPVEQPCNCAGDLFIDTTTVNRDLLYHAHTETELLYSRSGWHVQFQADVVPLPALPADSIVEIEWTEIDTAYPEVRAGFDSLESRFGGFLLRKDYPARTTGNGGNSYTLIFDDPVNVDDVAAQADAIPLVLCDYHNYLMTSLAVPDDPALAPGTELDVMFQGGTQDFWPAHLHRLGWQWGYYRMLLPLAWEITTGSPDIVIANRDCWGRNEGWGINEPVEHPDLPVKAHPDSAGQILLVTDSTLGDGAHPSLPLGLHHGLGVVSQAVAKGNDGTGMAGTCFDCTGLVLDREDRRYADADDTGTLKMQHYTEIDTDLETNGTTRRIAVLNMSYAGGSVYNDQDALIRAGVVLVAAAGNHMFGGCDEPTTRVAAVDSVFIDTVNNTRTWYIVPEPPSPAADVYTPDLLDPAKDYKVIAVGATQEGAYYDRYCTPFFAEGSSRQGYHARGAERFFPGFAHSRDTSKFNTSVDSGVRRQAKLNAYLDLVVPTGFTLYAVDGPSNCDGTSGAQSLCENGIFSCEQGRGWDLRKYEPSGEGTSLAAPQVAGIIGLMLSVNRFLGVPVDTATGLPEEGADVQRRAYNILTLTTEKIEDDGSVPPAVECERPSGLVEIYPIKEPTQPEYLLQANDPLRRSWGQRIGFGRVNAYRAVAHAIPEKGSYKYGASGTLAVADPLSRNPSGMRLLHLGAWREEGVRVTDSGGVAFPGGSAAHLNQGVTKLNGTGITLVVPDSMIVAIDGILTTEDPAGNNTISCTGSGRILINGYLNDVEVTGNTRIGDLTINGSDTTATGCVAVGQAWTTVELYGRLRLTNHGILNLNRGTMTAFPGSEIVLEGERDVEITEGGTLRLGTVTAVTAAPGRRIVVDSGSALVVEKGAQVDIDCEVLVRKGGEFLVDSGAVLNLKRFAAEKGGRVIFRPGSLVSLRSEEASICEGEFVLDGTATHRVRLIGRAADCCEAICDSVIQCSTVRVIGDIADTTVPLAGASIAWADVSNVGIRLENAALAPVLESNFSAHRDIFGGGALLEKTSRYQPSGGASFFTWFGRMLSANLVTMQNCTFSDEGGKIEREIRDDPYQITGVRFQGVSALAQFESCTFEHLNWGIESRAGGFLKADGNDFESCNLGVQDFGSALYLCENTFHEVSIGTELNGSKPGWMFDNLYDSAATAWQAVTGSPQRLRGNEFQAYFRGVSVSNNMAYLNTEPTTKKTGYERLGRNVFQVSLHEDERADVFMDVGASRVIISCGYNDFALNSAYHLRSETPQIIAVDANKFRDPGAGHAVRPFNVTPTGGPINVADTTPVQCDTINTPDSCAASITVCDIDPWWNDGGWIVYPREDPILDTFYIKAREEMLDTTLYWECRMIRARDALQAATLGKVALVEERFGQLRDDYKGMATDLTNHATLRSTALSLKGEVFERWGKADSAEIVYEDIVANYGGADSITAEWSLHYIAASGVDEDYGPSYDSAMLAWQGRVFDDLIGMLPGSGSPKPVPGSERKEESVGSAVAVLEQNVPNPFGGTTVIPFVLREESAVRLVITDDHGRVVTVVVDGVVGAGRHEVEVSVEGLPNGTYFYSLEVGSERQTKKMTVQR